MFETVLRSLDFKHFASGVHKMAFSEFLDSRGAVLVDMRAPEEQALSLDFAELGIVTLRIPIDELPDRVSEIPTDALVGLFCPTVVRSSIAYAYLLGSGFERVRILDGGYPALAGEMLPGKLNGHRKRTAAASAE